MANPSYSLPDIGDLVAGRYRIIREIGRGGYGVVFQASQEAIDRDVAIKFLLPDIASNPTEVERFRREIFHASSLEHHHTVTLYDYGKSPTGLFYVVMEYLEGINLRDQIAVDGPLEPGRARLLLEQVLGSLDEAHQRELVHRDLKPDNIFINDLSTGEIDCRVLDFGLSKFIGDPRSTLYRGPSLTAEGEICGTPQYMSPEHAYGETVGPSADIYSLGLVIYEAIVGEPAFDGRAPLDILLKQVKQPLPTLPERLQHTVIADFVIGATPKASEERFADAGAALRWLYQQPPEELPERSAPASVPNFLLSADAASDAASDTAEEPSSKEAEEIQFAPTEIHPELSVEEAPLQRATTPSPFETTEEQRPPSESELAKEDSASQAEMVAEDTAHDQEKTDRRAALERFELRAAQTPLVGRKQTLARLDEWLDGAIHRGGVFAITADAGSGKTVLLNTWASRLSTRRNLAVIRGAQPRNAPPLAGLHDLFESLLGDGPSSSSTNLQLSVEERFKLDRTFNAARTVDIDSEGSVSALIHGLSGLLDRLCKRQPLVLLFDDLHHADPITRKFFDTLIDSLSERQRPLAVVVTARNPVTIRPWKRATNAPLHHWPLPDLEESQLEDLLQRLLPVSDGLAAGVLKLASGNPALLLHICRYLLESNLVRYRDSRDYWVLADPSISIEELVPLDLQQLIIERANHYLQQSSDEAALRAILHRAVLLGDEFDAQILENCLRTEGLEELATTCRSLLAQLTASGLLEKQEDFRGVRYGFARPLHRASLVRMVESIDDWRGFHQLVAEELIAHDDEERPLESTRIAHHLERAGKSSKALPWWLRAARRAEAEHRYHDALQLLHRALRLHANRDADPEVLASMRLRQGRLSRNVGELGPAEDALRVAVDHGQRCEDTNLRARATELLAEVVLLQGRIDEATELLDDVDDLYGVLDDEQGKQRVDLTRADVAGFRGQYALARKSFEQILSSSTSPVLSSTEVRSLIGLARCYYAAGDLGRAQEMAEEARRRAHVDDHRRLEAAALVEAAHIALFTEGIEASESLAHQALSLARKEHDLLSQANAHLALGIALRRSTNIDRAVFHSQRARELHESLGHLYGILKDILLSAELAWVQGEPERALILAEDASGLHEDLGDQHGWALSTLYRALFLIEHSRAGEARQLLHKVLKVEGREQLGLYEPSCLYYLGLANEADLDIEEAQANFAEALAIAERIGHGELISLTSINLAKLHLVIGDIESARGEIDVALREAKRLGHAYANVFALLGMALLARLDGDPERLRNYMTRLRTYLVTPNAPDMRLSTRLDVILKLLSELPSTPQRMALIEAFDDLRIDLADI